MSGVGHCGCNRDTPDIRDYKKEYSADKIPSTYLYPSVDLRKYLHIAHVYDQGQLYSCTANAVCALYRMALHQTLPRGYLSLGPSRMFLWYNTRSYTGDGPNNAGASIRDTIKALNSKGMCKEEEWPYSNLFCTEPSESCYYSAKTTGSKCQYERLRNENIHQLRACLHENCPFVFGFKVYESFARRMGNCGCMPLPTRVEQACATPAGHAAVAVGYDDHREHVTVLNSWGEQWGDSGYFNMPYDFITDPNMCYDFWKITFFSKTGNPHPTRTASSGVGSGGASGYSGANTWFQYR